MSGRTRACEDGRPLEMGQKLGFSYVNFGAHNTELATNSIKPIKHSSRERLARSPRTLTHCTPPHTLPLLVLVLREHSSPQAPWVCGREMGQPLPSPPPPDSKALPLASATLRFSSTNLNPLKHRFHSIWHVLPHRPEALLDSVLTPGTPWEMGDRGLALGYLPGPGPGVPPQPAQHSLMPHHLQAASKP